MVSASAARRAKENEWLSDMTFHPGWGVVKAMAESLETTLLNKALEEADTEWDAIKKDGILRAVSVLRTHVSQVENRALEFRKKKGEKPL